jgi:hypothetical protein
MQVAALNGNAVILRRLLDAGADVNHRDSRWRDRADDCGAHG